MTEMYMTNVDYVDIHGRSLSVLIKSDGTVFVPLTEIRKTGFHIFPKSDYSRSNVGKSLLLDELRLYLLGAAKEFLIQRDVSVINHEDIKKSVEECRENLSTNGLPPQMNRSPSGVYGRQLLLDPKEVKPLTQSAMAVHNKNDNFGSNDQINRRSNSRPNDSLNTLRLPHQNDVSHQTNSDSRFPKKKQFNNVNKSNQNEQNRNSYTDNNQRSGKNLPRTNSESRSTSENEEGFNYVKLSDLNVKRVDLLPVMQNVKVVHTEVNNEKLKYWVQLEENDKIVLEILEKCFEVGDTSPVVEPKLNEIYLAFKDDLWYRVIVSKVRPVLKVHFLDFGNDAVVTEVRKIPDDLKSIPAQAVRIVLSRPEGATPEVLEMEEIVSVKRIKQFVDITYLVQKGNKIANAAPTRSPSEPIMIDEIRYAKALVDKEVIKIISQSDGKIFLRNKELHAKLVEVDMEIKNWKREKVNDVVPGQVVLCTKEGSEEKLCRAIVKKTDKDYVYVHFMDYHKDEKVPKSSLYAVNKTIANMPSTLIETPLTGYSSGKFNANTETMLEEMIMNNVKFLVEKKGSEVDLLLKDKSLSEILFPNEPKAPAAKQSNMKPKPKSENYVKVMYDDMKSFEAPMGKGDYMLTNYKDATDFTVTSTNDKESELLSRCTGIEVTDEEPYEPEETEMILAFFEGEWYRALVLEKCDDEMYQVLFVEYGNITEVTKKEIRRFPEDKKDIPILGLSCQLQVKNTEEVRRRLEQLLEPDNIYEINFISYSIDILQYTVEIPKITDILKKEGLI